MKNHKNNPSKRQNKDKVFKAEILIIYEALKQKPMTMKEAFVYSGVTRENICRHTKTLREQNKIAFTKKRKCSITGRNNVMEFTANPDLFPQSNPLNLL